MVDDSPFLQAIVAAPDDLAPRLIYANSLRSRGDRNSVARAEFIALQIDIESMKLEDARWPAIAQRERELLDQYRSTWERPLRAHLMPKLEEPVKWLTARLFGKGGSWGFRRGFVEDVSASVIGFMDADHHLFGMTPLRQVKLTNASTFVEILMKVPELDTLRSLHLVSDAEFDEDMENLLSNALEAGLGAIEVRVPRLLDGSVDIFFQLKGEKMIPERNRKLDDFPCWQRATVRERNRMIELASQPYFLHRLMETDLTSEADLLRMNDWVYLGDGPAQAKIWAVGKSFHDLEDEKGLCRRLLFYKPATVNRTELQNLLESPHFVKEHLPTANA